MQTITDLFAEKRIRAIWDNRTGKWWFSVVDVIAAINECDYETARNYRKWLKGKWEKEKIGAGWSSTSETARPSDPGSIATRTDFPTADSKKHFADVTDIKGLLRMIMAYPSPKAVPLRLWLADVLAENPLVLDQFAEIGEKSRKDTKKPTALQTVASGDVPD
ncbi:MAG: hypothetical protein FWF80_08415 [Defluviitaleaceae bacterium]|nr:hypothetical protein [Defluviitaleaceae bacterium]